MGRDEDKKVRGGRVLRFAVTSALLVAPAGLAACGGSETHANEPVATNEPAPDPHPNEVEHVNEPPPEESNDDAVGDEPAEHIHTNEVAPR